MSLKITVQDSVSDLFQVEFKDEFSMYLSQYVTSEPVYTGETLTGSRYVMKAASLAIVMQAMSI